MPKKPYQIPETEPTTAGEPAAVYKTPAPEMPASGEWNPNVPFHGTQEEWWEHFHRIEEGEFTSWEEHQKKFYAWKKNYLANLMK